VLVHLEILEGRGVLSNERGEPIDPRTLPLRDAHVLRALLTYAGVVPEEPGSYSCLNCGEAFEVAPSSLFEPGPFVDGELDDPVLDAPFAFGAWHPIPAVRVSASPDRNAPSTRPLAAVLARRVRLAERAVGEALPLWTAAGARVLRITPAVVTAMGVAGLAAHGERAAFRRGNASMRGAFRVGHGSSARMLGRASVVESSIALADALAGASKRAWGELVDLFHAAHYSPRLVGVYRCPACGARNDLDVPLDRELARESLEDDFPLGDPEGEDAASAEDHAPEREPGEEPRSHFVPVPKARAASGRRPFPDLSSFEARVRRSAAAVYRARGVKNIDLFIDAGVPACDDGGEPLLGCYTPGTAVGADLEIPKRPEIRLFYRTFKAEHRADPAFDLEAEIHETIDHEVTHHLHHLSGVDPLDDEERAEIAMEHARLVGRREVARRAARGVIGDITGFFRVTWPLWIGLTVAAALAWCR
jgi:DNA-directed RNA polymerase subunit RPC12/RpoP